MMPPAIAMNAKHYAAANQFGYGSPNQSLQASAIREHSEGRTHGALPEVIFYRATASDIQR